MRSQKEFERSAKRVIARCGQIKMASGEVEKGFRTLHYQLGGLSEGLGKYSDALHRQSKVINRMGWVGILSGIALGLWSVGMLIYAIIG